MRMLCATILSVAFVGLAGAARDDDNAKKIVGVWEMTKELGDLPKGTLVEFTKDGKFLVTIKADAGDTKFEGTYKLDKDKITAKLKVGEETVEESVTIKKLTDTTLEVEDKNGSAGTFTKQKK